MRTAAAAEAEIGNEETGNEDFLPARSSRQQLLADLFHALSQPVTTLRCCLELSLLQPRSAEEYRETLKAAAEQAEQVARWTTGLAELIQAGERDGDRDKDEHKACVLSLGACLHEAAGELQALAESEEKTFLLDCDSRRQIRFEPQPLRGTLLRLLEIALESTPAGAVVKVVARKSGDEALVSLSSLCRLAPAADDTTADGRDKYDPDKDDKAAVLWRRLRLAIIAATLESYGGSCRAQQGREGWRIECRLPLAPRPASAAGE